MEDALCNSNWNFVEETEAYDSEGFAQLAPDRGCILPCTQRLLCVVFFLPLTTLVRFGFARRPENVGKYDCSHPCQRPRGNTCPADCQTLSCSIFVKFPRGHVSQPSSWPREGMSLTLTVP